MCALDNLRISSLQVCGFSIVLTEHDDSFHIATVINSFEHLLVECCACDYPDWFVPMIIFQLINELLRVVELLEIQ